MLDKKEITEEVREITVITGGKYIESETGREVISNLALNETVQHTDKQEISSKPPETGETSKEISRNPKSQRKRPKVKNDAFFMDLKTSNKGKNMSNITLYHQNVRKLTNKIDELRVTMQNNFIGPHFVCLTEHHLKEEEITKFPLEGYKLASYFCRKDHLGGGVCIFI